MDLTKVVRLLAYRWVTAAAMLLAVVALYGAAALSRPDDKARAALGGRTAPITSVVSVCPGHEGTRLSLMTPGNGRPAGRADLAQTADGNTVGSLFAPAGRWSTDLEKAEGSFTMRASGELAGGVAPEQTTYWPGGKDRGLAGTRCARPGTDMWFVGPGPGAAERIDVFLTNVDPRPAAVDITALSGEGPMDTPDGRGTPVAPYSTKVVSIGKSPEGLGDLVAASRDLALRVRATSGRIAAAVRVRIGEAKGIEWLPVSPEPSTSVIVPGIPSGDGKRRVQVAVPGEGDASVKVQALTPNGAFAPEGQDVLDAPAKTVSVIDLDRSLAGKPGAVRLVANRPVIAGFAAERGADVAYGTGSLALGSQGGIVADSRLDTSVALTAPNSAATVKIIPVSAQGSGAAQDVKIAADRVAEVKITPPPGGDDGFGLLITPGPGSGPVHAVRTQSTGKDDEYLFTVLPVLPAITMVHLPPVGDSQRALIP